METKWYRVVAFGHPGGSAKKTKEEANESWKYQMRREYGYGWQSAEAAHSPRMYGATTKRAAEYADISETSGSIGRGKFWLLH